MSMELKKLIAQKWHLTIGELAKRVGLSVKTITGILSGESVLLRTEQTIRDYLENYKGE